MLKWNQEKVRRLSPGEIWLFIAGRVLAAFGAGLIVATRMPQAAVLGWPSLVAGVALLLLASKGLFRKPEAGDRPPTA